MQSNVNTYQPFTPEMITRAELAAHLEQSNAHWPVESIAPAVRQHALLRGKSLQKLSYMLLTGSVLSAVLIIMFAVFYCGFGLPVE